MKRNIPILITALSIIIAASSVSLAVKASKQRKLAEAETKALRQKIAEMPTRETRRRAPSTERNEIVQAPKTNAGELVTLQESPIEPVVEQKKEKKNRESREERMARMKAEDPEGYEEMIQKRKSRQEAMRYGLAERTATFMDLDTSNMTEEELANHDLLVEKMANVWALTEQFQDPEQKPDKETFKELFSEIHEARPLMEQERNVMFKQLGTDLGYEGENAQEFANHVEDIISVTTLKMPKTGGGRGGGRGGRGDGGGGR
jgi:hypothetical protein